MADPWTREIGRVEIPGRLPVVVGICHGAVVIEGVADPDTLAVQLVDHLAALLITACWQASAHPCPADCGAPVHDETCRPAPAAERQHISSGCLATAANLACSLWPHDDDPTVSHWDGGAGIWWQTEDQHKAHVAHNLKEQQSDR